MNETLFDDATIAALTSDWKLTERFVVPPFSTLDTRAGYWAERRARWDMLDLASDAGRGDHLTFAKSDGKDDVSQKLSALGATSIFDPVLCELIYRWWTPSGGTILDPFAGGSVRGIVAGVMGRTYHGVDLSADQVAANYATYDRLADHIDGTIVWHQGDSSRHVDGLEHVTADGIVSCPPYGTLERYSDHPDDLSTMGFPKFAERYRTAIWNAVDRLHMDRFAVFVVGNYREAGTLCDLVGLTVQAFGEAGADYYGDLVLLNATSSAAMRASATFNVGRKAIRVHQYVLVFVKGDWKRAAAACEQLDPKTMTTEEESP